MFWGKCQKTSGGFFWLTLYMTRFLVLRQCCRYAWFCSTLYTHRPPPRQTSLFHPQLKLSPHLWSPWQPINRLLEAARHQRARGSTWACTRINSRIGRRQRTDDNDDELPRANANVARRRFFGPRNRSPMATDVVLVVVVIRFAIC